MKMNQLLKDGQDKIKNVSAGSLKKTALNKIADTIAMFTDSENAPKKMEKQVTDYRDGSAQSNIPVKEIIDGIIKTTDGKYVQILEFEPVNFNKRSLEEQKRICARFAEIFRKGPVRAKIKVTTDNYSPGEFISVINSHSDLMSKNIEVQKSRQNYINHIREKSATASVSKRFFLFLQYEGENGKKSNDFKDIYETMMHTRISVINTLKNVGVVFLTDNSDNNITMSSEQTEKILYYLHNRRTCRTESYEERKRRVTEDYAIYNSMSEEKKEPSVADVIAPKGLYFTDRNYVFEDGQYFGYLGFKGNKWLGEAPIGWMDIFTEKVNFIDLDIIFDKLPAGFAEKALKIYTQNTLSSARNYARRGKDEKASLAISKTRNATEILNAIRGGEDLYNVSLILTVRANSPRELGSTLRQIKGAYKNSIEFEDGFLAAEDYYNATGPYMRFNTFLLSRLGHNITSSKIGSMFPFIGFKMNDLTGYCLGINEDDSSLVIIDNFNTKKYTAGNMLIFGQTGSGKSFTEMTIAGRAYLNGARVSFIIPKKGFEYAGAAKIYDGTYIRLVPGSKDCVNIMEIRPEAEADMDMLDSMDISMANTKASLLSKKISSIKAWFILVCDDGRGANPIGVKEDARLDTILKDVYAKYGITEDNNSIYDVNGKLKTMPILADFKEAIERDDLLGKGSAHELHIMLEPFITGTHKNLNGQTNVDLNKRLIIFDVDKDDIGERYEAAYDYIAFDIIYQRAKEQRDTRDVIILDEIWTLLKNKLAAAQVQNAILIVRSYYAHCILATQEIEKLLGNEFGLSLLNNTILKFYMMMQEESRKCLIEHSKLSPEMKDELEALERGHGILEAGKEIIKVEVTTTQRELAAYNTDRTQVIAPE